MTDLIKSYYSPTDSYGYYDPETGTYYNSSGQEIRDPNEYKNCEGYTPFGDE